jgi:hypothetical protein
MKNKWSMEMGNTDSEGTQKLKRVAALPYNPYFKKATEPFRQKYYGKADIYLGDSWFEVKPAFKRDVEHLLRRFGLPEQAFRLVGRYLLWGDDIHWTHYIDMPKGTLRLWDPYEPYVSVKDDNSGALFARKIVITNVGPWTSKSQWDDIWKRKVKQRLEELKDLYEKMVIGRPTGKKRSTLSSYIEQIQRYSEWHRLGSDVNSGHQTFHAASSPA